MQRLRPVRFGPQFPRNFALTAAHLMEPIDLLITARWIIPIEPANVTLEHHAIAIRQGRILAVLPTAEALQRYSPAEHIDRPTHVVIPGLVNAHTHVGMTLLRGAAENLRFDAWLKETIWPLEQRWLDPEFVRDGVELGIACMIASGTTCFGEQYMYPEVIAQTASAMHMRASVGIPILDLPTMWAATADEYLERGLEVHDEYRDDPLISTAFAPHSPYGVNEKTLQRIRPLSDEIELPITMHLHESPEEVAVNPRPLQRLDQLGMLNPLFSGIHMTQLIDADFELITKRGLGVVHCPQSNLKLGNGTCPVEKLIAAGVNVALGTDGAASNNDLDMLDELRSAALLGGPKLNAHQWLRIATLNGAKTLGLLDSVGSLVPGKWADVCCLNLDDVFTQPVRDIATAIVYSATRGNVSDVWIAGRHLFANHTHARYDIASILQRAQQWRTRMDSN